MVKVRLFHVISPAWALGKNPNLKIVGSSYSADLAEQFSRAIQRTIDTKEYQAIFPNTYLNGSNVRTDVKGYLRNVDIFEIVNHKGFYKAVGVGGSLTGTPVDIAIIDDPVRMHQKPTLQPIAKECGIGTTPCLQHVYTTIPSSYLS